MRERRFVNDVGNDRSRNSRVLAGLVILAIGALVALVGVSPSSAQGETFGGIVRVRGTAGGEFVDISWLGESDSGHIGEMFFDDTNWHEIAVNVPAQAQAVRVRFHNDGLNRDGADRNVIVDYFEINGVRIETESDEVYSVGVYNGDDCGAGYRNSEFLACNGYFDFNIDAIIDPSPPPGPDRIVVTAQGATGTETMALEVDGEVVKTWSVGPGTADYIYDGPIVTPDRQLRVLFTNDGLTNSGADRNLHVLLITVYDEIFDPIGLESKGVWNGTDCGVGFRNSNWLHCNGWFDVPGTTEPPPPPPPEETVEFGVVAAGAAGDEFVGVEINGEMWAAFELDPDLHTYTMRVPRPPYESFHFRFANDGLNDAGVDRNVFVDLFTLDGTEVDPRDLESLGNWNGTDCSQGYRSSPWLHCNGWFNLLSGDTEPPPPPLEDGIVAAFTGQGTTGNERVAFEINGEVLEPWTLSTANERHETILPDQPIESARLVFLNDAIDSHGDRNVRVSSIELDGATYDPRDLESQGTYNGVDCGIGFRNSNWLHCNGWFDLGLGDPDPSPPDVIAPTNVMCTQRPEAVEGSEVTVYEWTWTNAPKPEARIEVAIQDAGTTTTYVLDPGASRFVHEASHLNLRVASITAFVGDTRADVETSSITCDHQPISRGAVLLASYGPNNIEVTFNAGLGHRDISHYDVTLSGASFSETLRLAAGTELVSANFDGVPTDEVLIADIRTCYLQVPFKQCSVDGIGPRYNGITQIYLPSAEPPANAAMGAPIDVAFSADSTDVIHWDAPTTTDGLPFTYQVRSFAQDGNPGFQLAAGALHRAETRIAGMDSATTLVFNGLFYSFLPDSPHRFEVRACSDNGCGPWSESTDWRLADGGTEPYIP